MLTIIKSLNLALAFFLELCLLAALGYWGFRIGSGWTARIALGIGVPAVVIAVWGAFLAPASSLRLHDPWLLLAMIVLFGAATAALYAAGRSTLAWILAALFVVNSIFVVVWGQ
ncbi:MAG: YrdB family protein [Thermomicrobiales bacterium]